MIIKVLKNLPNNKYPNNPINRNLRLGLLSLGRVVEAEEVAKKQLRWVKPLQAEGVDIRWKSKIATVTNSRHNKLSNSNRKWLSLLQDQFKG